MPYDLRMSGKTTSSPIGMRLKMMSSLFDVASAKHADYFIVTVFLNTLCLV